MNCPSCNHGSSRVLETLRVRDGLRRRRICQKCAHRFDTLERIEVWDPALQSYVAVAEPAPEPAPPSLAAVPDHFVEPNKKVAKHVASLDDDCLVNVCAEAQPLLVQWWNESRKSKHRANATWTRAAWEASVNRVSQLPKAQQIQLCAAGVEHGWQALKPEYVNGTARLPQLPRADGRPMPKDPAMLAALESWPKQTA